MNNAAYRFLWCVSIFQHLWTPFQYPGKKYGCHLLGDLLALVFKPIDSEKLVLAAEVTVDSVSADLFL